MGHYVQIVEAVIARMEYHVGAGRMLDGLTFRSKPQVNIDGLKDFPHAMLFIPTISEPFRVGFIESSMRLNLSVSTKREDGIPVLLGWVEKVLDALETKPTIGNVCDLNLGETTRAFTADVGRVFALDLSLNAEITMTVAPKPMNRANRRNS